MRAYGLGSGPGAWPAQDATLACAERVFEAFVIPCKIFQSP